MKLAFPSTTNTSEGRKSLLNYHLYLMSLSRQRIPSPPSPLHCCRRTPEKHYRLSPHPCCTFEPQLRHAYVGPFQAKGHTHEGRLFCFPSPYRDVHLRTQLESRIGIERLFWSNTLAIPLILRVPLVYASSPDRIPEPTDQPQLAIHFILKNKGS